MNEMKPYNHTEEFMRSDPFRFLDDWSRRFFSTPFFGGTMTFRTDISDQGDSYLLEADLPGFDRDDIHIEVYGDDLVIRAERSSQQEEKKEQYLHCERSYGSCQRRFDVSGIDVDGIHAKYKDGVLRLTMPKKERETTRSRELKIEE